MTALFPAPLREIGVYFSGSDEIDCIYGRAPGAYSCKLLQKVVTMQYYSV